PPAARVGGSHRGDHAVERDGAARGWARAGAGTAVPRASSHHLRSRAHRRRKRAASRRGEPGPSWRALLGRATRVLRARPRFAAPAPRGRHGGRVESGGPRGRSPPLPAPRPPPSLSPPPLPPPCLPPLPPGPPPPP